MRKILFLLFAIFLFGCEKDSNDKNFALLGSIWRCEIESGHVYEIVFKSSTVAKLTDYENGYFRDFSYTAEYLQDETISIEMDAIDNKFDIVVRYGEKSIEWFDCYISSNKKTMKVIFFDGWGFNLTKKALEFKSVKKEY